MYSKASLEHLKAKLNFSKFLAKPQPRIDNMKKASYKIETLF